MEVTGGTAINSGSFGGGNFGILCNEFAGEPGTLIHPISAGSAFNGIVVAPAATHQGCNISGGGYSNQQCSTFSNKLCYGIYNNGGVLSIAPGLEFSYWQDSGDSTIDGARKLDGFGQLYDMVLAGGNAVVAKSQFTGHIDITGGVLTFAGGNGAGTAWPFPVSPGIVFAGGTIRPYKSVGFTCTGTFTASLTTGGVYGTGTNITSTACNFDAAAGTLGVGIPMDSAGTLGGLSVTCGTGGTNGSDGVFTVMKGGSTTTSTVTVGTSTATQFDGTHNIAYNQGDLISIQVATNAATTLAACHGFIMTQY